MRGLSTNPRVLLCTVYRRFPSDYLDIVGENIYGFLRASAPCRVSPGLRFIKQNVPEVEILEYPMWHEYIAVLKKGWDVVGFSFFQYQITEIVKMMKEARRHGVKELWAGGYGALDSKIPTLVDRVCVGPGEDQIAQIFGYRVCDEDIEHPVMIVNFSSILGIRYATLGMLYTTHGCPHRCKNCQTPVFEKRCFTIDLESIEWVLKYYRYRGINNLIVMDELFGVYPEFTEKLTRLFSHYKFRWWAQTRVSLFLRYLDTWYERGLRFPAIGVETMVQSSLDGINKKQKIEDVYEFACRTEEKPDMYRLGFYMIGYENMTVEQTLRDALRFKLVGLDNHGTTVLTPFPQTQLWHDISLKYGIFDHDYHHYGAKHLVWNHPYISPLQMHYLLRTLKAFLNSSFDVYRRGFKKLIWKEMCKKDFRFLWNNFIKGPVNSMFMDDRKQVFYPKRSSHGRHGLEKSI